MKTQALIFDFDDTLVVTNAVYDRLRLKLFARLEELGLQHRDQWADYLNRADIENIQRAGHLCPEAFPLAMRQTGQYFAALSGVTLTDETAAELENLGWSFYEQPVQCTPGAAVLLQSLHGRLPLLMLTVGDAKTQRRRIDRSGLAGFFQRVEIVREKTPQLFRRLVQEEGWQPQRVWMVGNSFRSDVNPALAAGLQVAHLDFSSWDYDREEPIGVYHTIHRLSEIRELIEL